jgi:hypothetical protein
MSDYRELLCFIMTAGMGGFFALIAHQAWGPGAAAVLAISALLLPFPFIWRIDARRHFPGR